MLSEIKKQIKAKNCFPVYLLHGNEPYFVEEIVREFENKLLTPGEKDFNLHIFYGKDSNYKQIIDTCMKYPMMSSHQLVILKEAQDLRDDDSVFLSYLKNPIPSTILILAFQGKRYDMRKAIGKKIKEKGAVFESKPIYENKLPEWIAAFIKKKNLDITSNASMLLSQHLGTKISKVVNELNKLVLLVEPKSTITDKIVEEHIGISKDYNVFELEKAIANKDYKRSFQIIEYFAADPKKNPLVVVLSSLARFFIKLYASFSYYKLDDLEFARKLGYAPKNIYAANFFVKSIRVGQKNFGLQKTEKILFILKNYDLKSKGVNQTNIVGREIMREMMIKIMNV